MITEVELHVPDHIEPMLAKSGEPFDSGDHVFELKWDGVRAVTYVDDRGVRMHGRRRRDLRTRYPELDFLAELPEGTVVDGELVVLRDDGKPDFRAVLSRENASASGVAAAARRHPVVYVLFDLLYDRGESLLDRQFHDRRERLQGLVAELKRPRLLAAEGVVGSGLAMFEAAKEQELEGIVAKRLDSPYLPGQRTDAWTKIKPVYSIICVVIGYLQDESGELQSLIIASDMDGELRCVGRVGSGISEAQRRELADLLAQRVAERPVVAAGMAGRWVAPEIYCRVSFLERTESGNLRAPVFKGLVTGGSQ